MPTLIVGGFMSAGRWAKTKEPTITQAAGAGTTSEKGGTNLEAPANTADVKRSMTIKQLAHAFPSITAAKILARLGAPLDTPTSTQLKTLVDKGTSIEVPTLRTWLEEQGAK